MSNPKMSNPKMTPHIDRVRAGRITKPGARPPTTHKPPPASKPTKKFPVNALKKRIRDLERLLKNVDELAADVRVERERELAASRHELGHNQEQQRRGDMIKRYHMVRFFERQKATRAHKKALKALNATTDPAERARLGPLAKAAEIDLNYTMYYPLMLPYVSLYTDHGASSSKNGGADDVEKDKATEEGGNEAVPKRRGDVHVRGMIVEAMENDSLERLRDRGDVEEIQKRRGKAKAAATASKGASSKTGKDGRREGMEGEEVDEG
ncbi:hypothetical protein P152DRAFT_478974 [Eremomyces bilateralis CBS 781.70]|uniref:rRNA-processing protein EFG1 n=1 Tax=Eremomyces bilateralis CBS 781.70 TaxID=1392243 RepID=A0A6G1GEA0_9PEZI|nr:uncharacterized protein P152DRAFT_478974 [Eremomyces bilateralis CBS 781.70]KAF1816435.1 hypothetical protein P152DRAFT_478974 [Eremomyces bilateralis CBS 781.70]